MTLYDMIADKLPKEKSTYSVNSYDVGNAEGYNDCKAEYDELLKRCVVDEDKVYSIINNITLENKGVVIKDASAKAISQHNIVKVEEGE